jgi:hypothetical protein
MARFATSLLLMGSIAVLATACGNGGSSAIQAFPSDSPRSGTEYPSTNGWDPFAPAGDQAPVGGDYPGCAGQQTATASEVLSAIVLPICELAAKCPTSLNSSQTTDTPSSGTQGADMGSTCDEILDLDTLADNVEHDGIAGTCEIFEALVTALQAHPECDPPITVPDGLCVDAIRQCIKEVVAAGCGDEIEMPTACEGISFGSNDNNTGGSGQGGTGQGGSSQGGSAGTGGTGGTGGAGGLDAGSLCDSCLAICADAGISDCATSCAAYCG